MTFSKKKQKNIGIAFCPIQVFFLIKDTSFAQRNFIFIDNSMNSNTIGFTSAVGGSVLWCSYRSFLELGEKTSRVINRSCIDTNIEFLLRPIFHQNEENIFDWWTALWSFQFIYALIILYDLIRNKIHDIWFNGVSRYENGSRNFR